MNETNITELAIHKGTLAQIQEHIDDIPDGAYVIVTDLSIPIPTASDTHKYVRWNGNAYVLSAVEATTSWGSIIGSLSAQTDLNTALSGKQPTISDLDSIRTGASKGNTSVQPSAISDMATKTWVGSQGFLTTHQSLAAYRTSSAQDAIDNDIREVAEGKTKNYVCNLSSNPSFNTQDESITILSFVDIGGTTHQASELKQGDNIYITDTAVPDRWCGVVASNTATMYKLETAKVPVVGVTVDGTTVVGPDGVAAIVDMATKTWVGQQGYLTQHQSLASYRTASEQDAIDAQKASATDLANHTSTSDIHRKITISTDDPSGGSDGDIWLKYEA